MFEAAELALYRLGAQPAHNNRTQRTAQVLISTNQAAVSRASEQGPQPHRAKCRI